MLELIKQLKVLDISKVTFTVCESQFQKFSLWRLSFTLSPSFVLKRDGHGEKTAAVTFGLKFLLLSLSKLLDIDMIKREKEKRQSPPDKCASLIQ